MDPLDSHSSLSGDGDADGESLVRTVNSLRLTVQIMLVALLILSGSVGIYLFRQVSLLRRQVIFQGLRAEQLRQFYNLNFATQSLAFEKQLIDFARTNPDFQLQLNRVLSPSNSIAAPAAPSTAMPEPGGQ